MKTIFWNVDTLNDFMNKNGKLYVQNAESIKPNLEKLTKYAAKNKLTVINSADYHTKESKEISQTPDFTNTFPEHSIRKTYGAEFIDETYPKSPYVIDWKDKDIDICKIKRNRNIIIYKDIFDVFTGNPYTDKIIETIKPDRAVVYGVATNVCVDYTVKGLLERGIEVFYVRDAIKELPNLPLEEVLSCWKNKGAKSVTTKEVLEGKL